jgi:hypothetical protein
MQDDPDFHAYFENPAAWDSYDVRRTRADGERILEHAQRAMRDPAQLTTLLGVQLSDVARLAPPERGASLRVLGDFIPYDMAHVAADEQALRALLGELEPLDAYWLPMVTPCGSFLGDYGSLAAFGDVLPRSATFITNARYDSVVYSEALPVFFATAQDIVVTLDASLPAGSERPGMIVLEGADMDASIRFPTYESGHEVSAGAPRELAEDVEAWLRETGATPGE